MNSSRHPRRGLSARLGVGLGGFDLDLEFEAHDGEVLALLGPNGSGKTTVLRAVAGLQPLDAGRIELDDVVLDDPAQGSFVPPEDRSIGMVFQHYLLFDHLNVRDNTAFGLRARGMRRADARSQAQRWLDRFALDDVAERRPAALSGGQAQRVALARALAITPRVLLLDEPLAALDAEIRRDVRRDLRRHLAEFPGVRILVTHDPVDVYALADRVAVLDRGRLVQQGTIAEITAHPRSGFVAELIGTNLIVGTMSADGLRTSDGVAVAVLADFDGPAFAVVRPQSVTLSRDLHATSARNTFRGVVDEIDRIGDRVRVGVSGPLGLTAEITVAALDSLALRPGDAVCAAVKATDIVVYPA